MSDQVLAEPLAATTADTSVPADTGSPMAESTAPDTSSAPSATDMRSAQMEALRAVRERDPAEAEAKPDEAVKVGAARAADGTFAAKVAPVEGVKAATDAPETKDEPAEPPAYLAADVAAVWAKLPGDARQVIAARAMEDRKTFSRLGNQIKAFEPFGKVSSEYQDYFETNKANPAQVFGNLMAWNKGLETDFVTNFVKMGATYNPSKAEVQAAILGLAKQHGIDGFDVLADPAQSGQGAAFDTLRRQNDALAARLAHFESTQTAHYQAQLQAQSEQTAQQETAHLNTSIAAVRASDAAEFDELRPLIAAEIQRLPSSVPDADLVKTAFENVKKRFDERVTSKVSAAEKTRLAADAVKAAKRAGSINIEGSASAGSPPAGSLRDEQRAALARARSNGASA